MFEWETYSTSGNRPDDIPAHPRHTYDSEFKGYADWLGIVNLWNKNALLALLRDLRSQLPNLEERELYIILQQGGALPALRVALGKTSPMQVLKDLKDNQGRELEQAIRRASDDEIATDAEEEVIDQVVAEKGDPDTLADRIFEGDNQDHTDSYEHLVADNSSDIDGGEALPTLATKESLQVIDSLAELSCGLDDEAAEYLVANRVSALWERYISEGRGTLDQILAGNGGRWFTEIKTRFLSEVEDVENLIVPEGWSFR